MPASAVAPSVSQAFTLDMYFNSATTDALETPVPAPGMSVPPGWAAQGYRAWRREWRAWQPGQSGGNPYWSPGLRKLVVGASTPVNSNYYSAQGQPFTINLWDMQGPSSAPAPSTASNSWIEVSAFNMVNGQASYINPPFVNYCWGGDAGNPVMLPFPALQTGQTSIQISQASASPVPSIILGGPHGGHYQCGPNTQQTMNVAALISLVFQSSISGSGGPIYLRFAVYTTLTPSSGNAVNCFDDPEMDVEVGSR